jgi:hypothetical protein
MRRFRLPLALAVLVLLAGEVLAQPPGARAVGQWAPIATPSTPSGATNPLAEIPLPGGRVLAVGYEARDSPVRGRAERYDPATDTWAELASWVPRAGNGAQAALPDGRVLFSGGANYDAPREAFPLAAAQLYDPARDAWEPAAPPTVARVRHTATALPDGTVLVIGGDAALNRYFTAPSAAVERYDPRTGRWSPAAPLPAPRGGHRATLLRDGRVLVTGGATADPPPPGSGGPVARRSLTGAALYDPATDRWTPAGDRAAFDGVPTLLPDGRVLATGGTAVAATPPADGRPALAATAELFDPATATWLPLAPLTTPRDRHTATPLDDGRVLVAGGVDRGGDAVTAAELYDPARGRWVPAAPLALPRADHTAVALLAGRVLVIRGRSGEVFADSPAPRACFAETGFCVHGRFLDYWQQHGGLARNGYPLGEERRELLEDGKEYTVQYFERVRLELHPENAAPYDVLLGQFGRQIRRPEGAVPPVAGRHYFPETGHNVGPRFFDYWQANGGLAQFGYPLGEDFAVAIAGRQYTLQYFERARFEYHPENAPPYDVLLGQFGRTILEQQALLADEFRPLYRADAAIREGLGLATGPAVRVPGVLQPFDRGLMLYSPQRPSTGVQPANEQGPTIYVLCGTPEAGQLVGRWPNEAFADTWGEGQDPGGGPAPTPGRYLPRRGFGAVWQDNPAVRDCVGDATTPEELGGTLVPYRAGTSSA